MFSKNLVQTWYSMRRLSLHFRTAWKCNITITKHFASKILEPFYPHIIAKLFALSLFCPILSLTFQPAPQNDYVLLYYFCIMYAKIYVFRQIPAQWNLLLNCRPLAEEFLARGRFFRSLSLNNFEKWGYKVLPLFFDSLFLQQLLNRFNNIVFCNKLMWIKLL